MQAKQSTAEPRWAQEALRYLPWAIWAFLLVFAWQFADERLYSDSGYYLARVINEGTFRIEHGRWVLAIAQVLPLIGVKLGLGMKGLILLSSLNNVLWLCACMLFAARVLRDRNSVLMLAAVHLIGLTHGLFCPVFELYYGVDLLILFQAVRNNERLTSRVRWALCIVFLLGAISSHFFAMLLAAGLLLMDRIWRDRRSALVFAGLFATVLILHMTRLSKYERGGLATLAGLGDPSKAYGLFAPSRLKEFIAYLAIHYADVAVLALFGLVALLMLRQRWTAMSFVAVLFVLFVSTGLYLPGFIHDRYREQVNFATTAWVLLVIGSQLLPLLRWRSALLSMLVVAALFRMVRAEWIAPWYVERTDLTEARIAHARELGLRKAIVQAPVYFGPPHHLIDLSWSTSVESLLLSAKDGPGGTVSLVTTEDIRMRRVRAQLDRFIFRRWDILDPSWLNAHYFQAPTGRYVPLPDDPVP